MPRNFVFVLGLLAASAAIFPVMATNGMNLEGYGPISTGMGGTSFAFDNGSAALMNNPATLGLNGSDLTLDLALGNLGPNVKATVSTPNGEMEAESSADAFYMPALGILKRSGDLTFGLGVFGQGGMGTEFSANSWMADPSMGANTALESGLVNRSEVSVGRVLLPLTYQVNEKFRVGGSFDVVWASMDLQMAMSEAQFQNLANPQAQTIGTASGSMVSAFGQMYEPFGGSGISKLHHAYFDYSNDSDFAGEAFGSGLAAKLGLLYQATPQLTVGATYHSKTSLSDLETDNATMSMAINVDPGIFQGAPTGTYMDMNMPIAGEISVKDFQWPAIYGAGLAYRPNEKLLLACDVKVIGWADVMEQFQLVFVADDSPENGGFAGLEMDAVLFQEWEDQTVFSIGGAYQATDAITVRAGLNTSKNPIPDTFVNALFPAIVENHISFGAGYKFNDANGIDLSMTAGTETTQTNAGNGTTIPPVESSHSQFNWQFMYSHNF